MKRVVAIATIALLTRTAIAEPKKTDPSSDARAMAETLFFAGRGLMDAGRYQEACQRFQESYRLDAAAGTLLNLATCHEKIGKIASAWGEFKQSLAEAEKAKRPDRITFASEHIKTLEPDLPYLTITVLEAAAGLEVFRNGGALGIGSLGIELPVDPGDVEIAARAPGYVPSTTTIKIELREHRTVALPRLVKAKAPVVLPRIPEAPAFWTSKRVSGMAVIGVGLVTAGIGTWYGLKAIRAKNDSDRGCPVFDAERRCDYDGSLAMDRARAQAWHSTLWLGVSLVTLAAGGYLVVTGGHASERRVTVGASPMREGAVGFIGGEF